MSYINLSRVELLAKCEELNITKYKSKNKADLIKLIEKANIPLDTVPDNKKIMNNCVQSQPALIALDLFCGCGGMSKGLTDAGIEIIAGIDIWDKAINSYRQNFAHTAVCADLTQLSPAQFHAQYNQSNHSIDLIVGGPPCQGFSIAGKRNINDPRNSLFMEYVKYIKFYTPRAFIMENVIGLLSMKTDAGEQVLDIILAQFNEQYNCIVNKLYACDFEVPQSRRRVIIIGIRKDLKIMPTAPTLINAENRIPVRNVLLPRNEIPRNYFLSDTARIGIQNKRNKSIAKGAGFGAQYLDLDKPSYTIPARYWKDGYDALVKYSDIDIRRLTILELKRIQSFPDNYILDGSKKDIIMQIGNAVACKFAYHLGKYIINILQQ